MLNPEVARVFLSATCFAILALFWWAMSVFRHRVWQFLEDAEWISRRVPKVFIPERLQCHYKQRSLGWVNRERIDSRFPEQEIADSPTCAVCLDVVDSGEPGRKLDCMHVFHSECIASWWTSRFLEELVSVACPVCRAVHDLAPCEVMV
mmetsp:Transcript_67428/g.173633  ORF Transcript_67428/g.173633 Transcript_67428/m.173633 type:complete len:149 (+) Transcript_67428:83-529(+)